MKKKLLIFLTILLGVIFTGCSSLDTVIRKRNLSTQTKLSETIWLNPETSNEKTIFVQIKNTSTNNIQIEDQIKATLINKGYKITNNPKLANYWLQGNILNLEKMNKNQTDAAFNALAGAGIGATLGAYNTGSLNSAIGLGVVGGVTSVVANALIEDTYYTMITDILISEKSSTKVKISSINALTQGTRGVNAVTKNSVTNMNKYQTRVISAANKVNLHFQEAEPQLKNELVKVISNIF